MRIWMVVAAMLLFIAVTGGAPIIAALALY
jgi:hypothetical protein